MNAHNGPWVCGGAIVLLFIGILLQVLGDLIRSRRGTLLIAAFVVVDAATTAIGRSSRHLVRRLRGVSAAPIRRFGQDEASSA